MAGRRKHRGVSVGTVLMLCVTAVVLLGFGAILPKLGSNTHVTIDTGKVLQALSLGDHMPELSLDNIPITVIKTETAAPVVTAPATEAPAVFAPVVPTATPTAAPTATPVPGGSFTAVFGGSINIDSDLRQEHYFKEAQRYDFQDVLMLLEDQLTADLSMVTLENTIDADGKLSDVNTTADVLPMLSRKGVNMVALAHKNVYNYGMDGLQATLAALDKENLPAVGAYAGAKEAGAEQRLMEVGGVKVALLHYTTDALADKGRNALKKDGNTFAVAQDTLSDGADAILADVAEVRAQGAQVVMVSLNSTATLNKSTSNKKQIAFAQQLADAGVDVIIGNGSRVVQPVTWLTGNLTDGTTKQVLCAYSLGNFISTQNHHGYTDTGMILEFEVNEQADGTLKVENVGYVPTYCWKHDNTLQVVPALDYSESRPEGMGKDSYNRLKTTINETRNLIADEFPEIG